jgi:hypothetical protein
LQLPVTNYAKFIFDKATLSLKPDYGRIGLEGNAAFFGNLLR